LGTVLGPWRSHLLAPPDALILQKTAAVDSIAFSRAREWSSKRSMTTSSRDGNHPLEASYSAFCKEAGLQRDGTQQACIQQMMGIYDAVTANPSRTQVSVRRKPAAAPVAKAKPKAKKSAGMFSGISSMFNSSRAKPQAAAPKRAAVVSAPSYPGQKGLYLYGGCGCGKTLLLDLMYRTLLEHSADFPVRRLHWHKFVRDGLGLTKDAPSDVVAFDWLADKISRECKVLILDELMITHISEAMLVRELFMSLWSRGIVTLVSSNYKPEDLYAGGLNRVVIEPFLAGDLQKQMPLFDFNQTTASRDFRALRIAEGSERFFPSLADESTRQMDLEFQALVGDVAAPLDLEVPNEARKLHIYQASSSHGVARLPFDNLCRQPRGRSEFSALAESFHTVFIDTVPRMTAENDGIEFQRFVSLIDILYDKKVKLHMQSEVDCNHIYQPPAHQLEEMELLGSDASQASGQAGDALWAWKRTQNKLNEMSSDVWPKICDTSRTQLLGASSGSLVR
jgi:cell division protein ZapE